MEWGKFLGLFFLMASTAYAGGLCTFDTTSDPALPYATCMFPSCPIGANCLPPTIKKESAKIAYNEPMIQWNDACPDTAIEGACWQVQMKFSLQVEAESPNGISYVGVNLSQETNGQRVRNKYWGKAQTKDGQGRYNLDTFLVSYVQPGQRLMLEVHELCAKDGSNNEGCIIPIGGQILTN